MDGGDRDKDGSAFSDEDAVDELAGGGADGVSEWDRVLEMHL